MSSARLNDYVKDVTMDIDQKFYPLPLITIPDIAIPKPVIPEYNFHNERKAIAEYEKEKAARSSVAKEEPTYSKAVSTTLPLTLDTALRKVRSEGILEPSPAPLNNNSLRKTKSKKMNAVNSFEEFEAKPSLFDLLEMNTIDDKAALEEVLLASVKGERRENANDVKL